MKQSVHEVNICGLTRELPLVSVAPNLKIALFNILGETELIEKVAREISKKLPKNTEVLASPEVKGIFLAYELSRVLKIPYVVIRKNKKPYMTGCIKTDVLSITTGKPQTLWIDGKDKDLLRGKKVVLVDDVISTGGTLESLRKLMKKAKAEIVAETAVFTEGKQNKWPSVIAIGNLPLFNKKNEIIT